MAEISRQKTLRDLWRVLFRHRYLFLLSAALVALLVLIVGSTLPRKYTGTARFERRSVDVSQGGAGGGSAFESYKSVLRQDLAGRQAIEMAIASLNLDYGFPRNAEGQLEAEGLRMKQDLVLAMQRNIDITYDVKTQSVDVVAVSYTCDNPWGAEKVPNFLMDLYIQKVVEKIQTEFDANIAVVKAAADTKRKEYETAQEERIEHEKTAAGKLQDPNYIGELIARLETDIDELGRTRDAARKTIARLEQLAADAKAAAGSQEGQDKSVPAEVIMGRNPELDRLNAKLTQAKEELDKAVNDAGMKEDHPTVQRIKATIARLEEEIKNTPEEVVASKRFVHPGTFINPYAADLASANTDYEVASRAIEQKERELARQQQLLAACTTANKAHQEYLRKEAEAFKAYEVARNELNRLEEQRKAELAKRRTNLYKRDVAEQPYKPSSPVFWQLLVVALVAGLAAGSGLVFLTHTLDRTIATTEEAMTYFDVPIYGVVGEIRTPRDLLRRKFKSFVVVPIVSVILILALAVAVLNLWLYLEYPAKYLDWSGNYVGFVLDQLK